MGNMVTRALTLALLVLGAGDDPAAGPAAGGGGAAAAADPDAPTVGASLDRTEAHLGDRLTLTVSAVAKAGVAITLPQKLDLGSLEVLDRSNADQGGRDLGDGRRSHRFVLGVAAYDVGELSVPAIELSYINPRGEVRSARTEPIPLRILGVVPTEESQPQAQPARPPRSALVEDKRVIQALRVAGLALAGALAVFIAYRLLRRALKRLRPAIAAPIPRRPPEEVALEKLRALGAAGDYAADGFRPFYFALSEIVREYLGARYGFDSLELTTTELMEALDRHASRPAAPLRDIEQLLASCDLVKFAKAGSTQAEASAALGSAEALVLATSIPVPPADQPFAIMPISDESAEGDQTASRQEGAGG